MLQWLQKSRHMNDAHKGCSETVGAKLWTFCWYWCIHLCMYWWHHLSLFTPCLQYLQNIVEVWETPDRAFFPAKSIWEIISVFSFWRRSGSRIFSSKAPNCLFETLNNCGGCHSHGGCLDPPLGWTQMNPPQNPDLWITVHLNCECAALLWDTGHILGGGISLVSPHTANWEALSTRHTKRDMFKWIWDVTQSRGQSWRSHVKNVVRKYIQLLVSPVAPSAVCVVMYCVVRWFGFIVSRNCLNF